MTLFKHWPFALILALSGAAQAQHAINIDQDGTVTIPGQLTVGSVQAGNLDQTLIDLMNEVKGLKSDIAALNSEIAQEAKANEWYPYAQSIKTAIADVTDADILNLEFGIIWKKGFRSASFSQWNSGVMFSSEGFMTGDRITSGQDTYALGGVMWISGASQTGVTGPFVPSKPIHFLTVDELCGTGEVYFMYYTFKDGNLVPMASYAQCGRADSTIYARKRAVR